MIVNVDYHGNVFSNCLWDITLLCHEIMLSNRLFIDVIYNFS